MNEKIICITCGTQYNTVTATDDGCPICNDDRQYVPETGQAWTTLARLQNNYSVIVNQLQRNLYELKMVPAFAIGQRALLVLSKEGNILWDCIALINDPVIEFIKAKGGLKAIAFSHPHYYTTMNDWAGIFDCPVYIHAKDEQWIFNKGKNIQLWDDAEKPLWDGISLINIGGHFPGSSILHVPFLSAGGTILCGDTFYVSPSKEHAAVMYSYPNRIPLPQQELRSVAEKTGRVRFDSLYGFYDYQNLQGHAKEIVENSLKRYL